MQAHETTFQQLIQGEKQFQVPLYQRTYSWDRRQLSRLWTDVLEQAESLREPGTASTHFLGSVVLVPSPSLQASGVQKWLVVDGQQRLTTLMLAMCAIRDHLGTHDPQQRDRINELYLTNKWQRDLDRFRLLPTQADREAFIRCVNAAPTAGTSDKLGAAYRFFQTALLDADDIEDPHDIGRIETVVRERLAIVEITCERHDNVHRIFESLNNTGLSLSQADLLRNYVFMLLPARGQDVYSDVWLPMQESLGARNLELLAWLDLLLRGQERVRLTEVYEAQKRRLEPLAADEAAIAGEVGELARRAVLLRRILEPENEPDPRLRPAFDRLNRWQAQTAYPVLLRLLELQGRGRCGADELMEALSYVESFLVRRMLVGVPTNNLNRIFNAVTQELEHADSVPRTLRTALSAQRRRWPRDDEVRDAIRSRPFYWQGRAAQRVLVLRRLEEDLGSGEPVDFRAADLTIEHVLPQTLSDSWRAELANDVADDSTVEELHQLLVHTLGNLTLTAYNPTLGNLPFDEKRTKLRDSAFRMNQRIAARTRWGKAEIHERAAELADRAISIWPAPLPGVVELGDARDWSLLRKALAALPSGSWTTYGDLAELIGSHPVPVGAHLSSAAEPNAQRVLQRDGTVSRDFRWVDPDDTRDPLEILRAEGVHFSDRGVADPSQRMTAADLADLLGMRELPEPPAFSVLRDAEQDRLLSAFREQVGRAQSSAVASAVDGLLDHWSSLGGTLEFGSAEETSCFLMLRSPTNDQPDRRWWPLTIYPSGPVEVVFQHLSQRPPWDDESLRDDLRRRLNAIDGVAIDATKLSLRPSFPLVVLRVPQAGDSLSAALEWFMVRTARAVGATSAA